MKPTRILPAASAGNASVRCRRDSQKPGVLQGMGDAPAGGGGGGATNPGAWTIYMYTYIKITRKPDHMNPSV